MIAAELIELTLDLSARAWPGQVQPAAQRALAAGHQPVFGFSCYTWNVAEFIELARRVKAARAR